MKFYFDNGTYALRNMGDIAMLQLAHSRFAQRWPDAEFVIQTDDAARLQKLIPNAIGCPDRCSIQWKQPWNLFGGIHKLVPKSFHDELRYWEIMLRMRFPQLTKKLIRRRLKNRGVEILFDTFVTHLQSSDAVVATGGGYITDEFETHAISILETLGLAASMGHPVAMFGQGIGPVRSPRLRRVAALVLPRLHLIALRESRCAPSLLQQLGVPSSRVVITGDDAIEIAAKVPTESQDGVGFNIRLAEYSGMDPALSKSITDEIKSFAKAKSTAVIPIPISMNDGESDAVALGANLGLGEAEGTKLTTIDNPQSVIEQIGRCRLVVTGSYHAGVFALSKGIPVVGLFKTEYYEDKFRGLASQFTTGCDMVDLRSPVWPTELRQKTNRLWDDYRTYEKGIRDSVSSQIKASQSAYERFFDLIDTSI